MASTRKKVEVRSLKICHVFADSIVFKQQICCSFLRMGVELEVTKLVFFY